ncbi:MAG: hypothetical protein JSU86_10670 [Phycisphaerales bacterium]|nr:MAG: hypothetical protein JSU86_10670 [Phycisphaerales bacterium]
MCRQLSRSTTGYDSLHAIWIAALITGVGTLAHGQAPPVFTTPTTLEKEDGSGDPAIPGDVLWTEPPVLLSPDVPVHRVVVVGGPGGGAAVNGAVSSLGTTCEEDPSAVYCNTLGREVFAPAEALATARIADDITLAGVSGCVLDRYVIRVTGDRNGDGSGPALGAYTVNFALYEACPGAGADDPIEGTSAQVTVPAEEASVIKEIVFHPSGQVELPPNLYLGVSFSRDLCGVVLGAPATLGFSADRFDFPGFRCAAAFGGFPDRWHASFYAEIYVEGECPDAFVGYKNTNHAGRHYSAGVRARFADDVRLGVIDCNMVAYEIAHKGDGIIGADLRSLLSDTDPEQGGLIPGTELYCFSSGNNVQICRKEFETPIPLPSSSFFVVYSTSSGYTGPLQTCKRAKPGDTENSFMVYTAGEWRSQEFDSGCWGGFELTIFCEGQPPVGACCDMILTDEEDEAVCRELPEMNCPSWVGGLSGLWTEGAHCAAACIGGEHDGEPCTRQADCPEGICPGPFRHPCGLSACCKPDDTCEDLTGNECRNLVAPDEPIFWNRGAFCGERDQACPFYACLARVGDCSIARPETGCENPYCCTSVCNFDPWCCQVAWDDLCVRWSYEFCNQVQSNDSCSDPHPERGALLVNTNSSTYISTAHGSVGSSDPGFCCNTGHESDPDLIRGSRGYGTVWFKFVAPPTCDGGSRAGQFCDPNAPWPDNPLDGCPGGDCLTLPVSVQLDTCCSVPREGGPAHDSLIQVYTVAEPDRGLCGDGLTVCSVSGQDCADGSACAFDEEYACANLIPIACSDDDQICDCMGTSRPTQSRVCVRDVIPGQIYYAMVGAKTNRVDDYGDYIDRGLYELRLTSPCDGSPLLMDNDLSMNAELLTGEHVIVPFDISGEAFGRAPATFDCPPPPVTCFDVTRTMQNDVWYEWIAPCDGRTVFQTCGFDDEGNPSDELTSDTAMVVYDGCVTPVEIGTEIGCQYFDISPCFLGSRADLEVTKGNCYKVRLGGRLGKTHDPSTGDPIAGDLRIDVECTPCPAGEATFIDPPDGVVDARQPHPIGNPGTLQGIDTIIVGAPGGADATCFTLCETNENTALHPPYQPGFETNEIISVEYNGEGAYALTMKRPITPGEVTTISYTDGDGVASTGQFMSHPANVNSDGTAGPADILAVIDILNGVRPSPWGAYSADVDHSGAVGPPDILRVIDLLNHGWLDTSLPTNPGVCP